MAWNGRVRLAGRIRRVLSECLNLEKVKDYILRQEEHHQKVDFKAELVAMLKKHGVSWDERYIWD